MSYTRENRLPRCDDGLGRPTPQERWGHRPHAFRAIKSPPSTTGPIGSPTGTLVMIQEGLAVVPRTVIGPGVGSHLARRSNRGHLSRSLEAVDCGSTTDDKCGSNRSPHSCWNQQARLCGGRSPVETAKAAKRGRRQRRGIPGSTTCQCDAHQQPQRLSRFAWCGWKWMGGSSQGNSRGRGVSGASSTAKPAVINVVGEVGETRWQPTVAKSRPLNVGYVVAILPCLLLGVGHG